MEVEPIYCAEQARASGGAPHGARRVGPWRRRHSRSTRARLDQVARHRLCALTLFFPRAWQIVVPAGLDEVLKQFAKEAIRAKPQDVVGFAAE
jgi:ribosomal protein L32E